MSANAIRHSTSTTTSMPEQLRAQFDHVRRFSEELCEPLEVEDYVIQSMPDVSPTRWHLAHTTWFFETFLLKPFLANYRPEHEQFEFLFNSYYNAVGKQFARPQRGLLSRPTVAEVYAYRHQVEADVIRLLESCEKLDQTAKSRVLEVLEIGIHHEQQHQELMITDIKHVFSCNPLLPSYVPHASDASSDSNGDASTRPVWAPGTDGLVEIGDASDRFTFDNERPRHTVFLSPYRLRSHLVTNCEYLEFMAEGGYQRPELWLSLGWQTVEQQGWEAPLYWFQRDGEWQQFTLRGVQGVDNQQPVTHVSYFEADAFSRWCGYRLPKEAEWEVMAADLPVAGNFVEQRRFYPAVLTVPGDSLNQMYGDVWEWTSSPYTAYPGYQVAAGALGEYNGKFMCNQYVLRGGSCASSQTHLRPTYRNFFPPDARWQFTGIRLAMDDG